MVVDHKVIFPLSGESQLWVNQGDDFNVNTKTISADSIHVENGQLYLLDSVLDVKPLSFLLEHLPNQLVMLNTLAFVNRLTELETMSRTLLSPTDSVFVTYLNANGLDFFDFLMNPKTPSVMDYHILEEGLTEEAILARINQGFYVMPTLSGYVIMVTQDEGTVKFNGPPLQHPDLTARNGVMHVLNDILFPQSLLELASHLEPLETFLEEMHLVNLQGTLSSPGPVTIFAPVNEAFTQTTMPTQTAARLERLRYHVVEGNLFSETILDQLNEGPVFVETLSGHTLTLTKQGDTLFVNGAAILIRDVIGTNGVIHLIDDVLTPPSIGDLLSIVESVSLFAQLWEAAALTSFFDLAVVAPSNEKVQAYLDYRGLTIEMLMDNHTELLAFVEQHTFISSNLPNPLSASTTQEVTNHLSLRESSVRLKERDNTLLMNTHPILYQDLKTTDGVVHLMEGIFFTDIEATLHTISSLSLFEQAYLTALGEGFLDDVFLFYMIAPTNEAIEAYLDTLAMTFEDLLQNEEKLTRLVTYHLVDFTTPSLISGLVGDELRLYCTVEGSVIMISDNIASLRREILNHPTDFQVSQRNGCYILSLLC